MTLNDILTAALAQLDRGHDAQTLEKGKFQVRSFQENISYSDDKLLKIIIYSWKILNNFNLEIDN